METVVGKDEEVMLVQAKVKKGLRGSIEILKAKCENADENVAEYNKLDVRRKDFAMEAAKKNGDKNRYKNIWPYDCTRVKLEKCTSDYINANHIQMDITGTAVNKYIAAQGPLPETSRHFWIMVFQQRAAKIVMLTSLTEGGRIKCHQYWPENGKTNNYGKIQVTCTEEVVYGASIERKFTLTHLKTKEERYVTQHHYTHWPDCGVPDHPTDFIDFLNNIREEIKGNVNPMVVHCSAGVGRTGVFISLDTAWSQMKAYQPVYPLDIVKKMREQRPMCVQTPVQYKFICNAIVKIYDEKINKHKSQAEKKPSVWKRLVNCLKQTCCCQGGKEETPSVLKRSGTSYRGHRRWGRNRIGAEVVR